MNINATLIGQMITFAIFVWFTMKFVWPMLEEVLNARQKKIADGLEAAERGHKELDISQKTAIKTIREAREQAEHTLDLARRQAKMIIETATTEGVHERERLIDMGKAEIEKMIRAASDQLEQKIINLTMVSTEKLLERSLTERDQKHLLEIAKETVSGA